MVAAWRAQSPICTRNAGDGLFDDRLAVDFSQDVVTFCEP